MIQSQIPCHLRSNNTHQSPEQATREMYVWHLTPSWNSLYFVTLLAARVLDALLNEEQILLKNPFSNLLPICDRPSTLRPRTRAYERVDRTPLAGTAHGEEEDTCHTSYEEEDTCVHL